LQNWQLLVCYVARKDYFERAAGRDKTLDRREWGGEVVARSMLEWKWSELRHENDMDSDMKM
jgi:hypothetical protein